MFSSESHRSKFWFFTTLYFVQGVALAYFTGFQKRYLLGEGISGDRIAMLTSLVLVPFILKPILGFFADWLEFQRKHLVALGLALASLTFGVLRVVNPAEDFVVFSALVILASVGVSLFDTMADALAVDAFDDKDYGPLQSSMLAGKSLGLILFSVIFGFMIDERGYSGVFVFMSVLMLIPFVMWGRIQNLPRKERFQWTAFRALGRRDVLLLALFGVLYSIPSFGIWGLFSFYFSSLGWSATQVGSIEAIKSVGAVAGALAFAALLRKFSLSSLGLVVTLVAVVVSAALPWVQSTAGIYFVIAVFGVMWALRETLYLTVCMKATEPAIAATMFSLLMAFSNLGTSIGEGWATAAAGRRGFAFAFVFFALLNLASLWFWRALRRQCTFRTRPYP